MLTADEIQRLSAARSKKLREDRGLTLAELAHRTGNKLSKSRINNYEQARRMLGPWEAVVLASALGTSAAYLLCIDDENGRATMSHDEIALILNLRTLPHDVRVNFAGRIAGLAAGYRHVLPDESVRHAPPVLVASPESEDRSSAAAVKLRQADSVSLEDGLTLGDRVRQLREAMNLTQPALARAVGVSQPSLYEIESGGTKTLRAETLMGLAKALGEDPEYILTGRRLAGVG
jgi:transcriptional regulator with XRE-family HTH domain